MVERASKRILRFLQRRGVITLVTAPDDGEVTVVTDETWANFPAAGACTPVPLMRLVRVPLPPHWRVIGNRGTGGAWPGVLGERRPALRSTPQPQSLAK